MGDLYLFTLSFTSIRAKFGYILTKTPTTIIPITTPPHLNMSTVVVDKDGRKRLRPTLLSSEPHLDPINRHQLLISTSATQTWLESAEYPQQRTYGRRAIRTSDQLYLGLPLGVDEIFFGNTELEDADNFTIRPHEGRCTGQQSYVNARMKYFLRSPQLTFQRDRREYVGIVPYPERFSKPHQPPPITIFSNSSNGVTATKSKTSKWFKDKIAPPSTALGKNPTNVCHRAGSALTPDDDGNAEWQARQADKKWKTSYGKDDDFPPYGDSGSEGKTDLETWKKIEREAGKLTKSKLLSKSKNLPGEEVERIIDTAMEHITQDWIAKMLPRLEPTEWRLWTRSRKNGTEKLQIRSLENQIDKLEARITNYRKEIAGEEWSKSSQVTKMCKILQPSIVDREDNKWKLSTLTLAETPAKPPPKAKKHTTSKPPIRQGEEDVDSYPEDSDYNSNNSLDDFIVHDEPEEPPQNPGNKAIATTLWVSNPRNIAKTIATLPRAENATGRGLNPGNIAMATMPRAENATVSGSNFIDLTQFSDSETDEFQPRQGKKPVSQVHINDIRAMDPAMLVELQDREGLLIWMVSHAPAARREAASSYLRGQSMEAARSDIKKGLQALLAHGRYIRGMDSETSNNIMQIAVWHVCWTIPVKLDSKGIQDNHLKTTLSGDEGFERFYDHLLQCLVPYDHVPEPPTRSTPEKKQKQILKEDSAQNLHYSPFRKRKYSVSESQETVAKRQATKDRVRETEERRRREELRNRFADMELADRAPTEVVVNPGKLDEQEFVYLNPRFGNGARIKPHQEAGLQFLWREITAEYGHLEGCLLAQTMGLGKTMQVIALIVTLAEAAKSSNQNILLQVPPDLREFRTLVLCPPALVDNWWDEFLLWVPDPHEEIIGTIRKVTAALSLDDRLCEVKAWDDEGGVLLMGYHTFKDLIHNKAAKIAKTEKQKAPPLNDSQHREVKTALLKRASLVVADEAHAFKSPRSSLNRAMIQFKTKSRIALTGSPLNNHLEEYYTIVDWIAPDYLGSLKDFRATYGEPIQEGLYQNSNEAQYRQARKKLKALELEMDPKVHRANASVLLTDLKGKTEFIIKLPLTPFQDRAYNIFVDCMRAAASGEEPLQTTLWSWIGILKLLCNHPYCYREKLLAIRNGTAKPPRSKAPTKKTQAQLIATEEDLLGSDEDASHLNDSVSQIALSRIARESEKVFEELTEPIEALRLSNKMQVLMELLRFSDEAHDKILVFSHSIPTLNYVGEQLRRARKSYARIDGSINVTKRQDITKDFNDGNVKIGLISTRAGGIGINLFGANRVVILDEHFNPMWEQQAIGRAYRIGQQKQVFVYRLTVAGTFEQAIQNQALFKEQLATRVVDKRNPTRRALKGAGEYLFPPKHIDQENVDQFKGRDVSVLDRILADPARNHILSITPTDTFHVEDGFELTAEEMKEAEQVQRNEQLRRRNLKVQEQERMHAVQLATLASHP